MSASKPPRGGWSLAILLIGLGIGVIGVCLAGTLLFRARISGAPAPSPAVTPGMVSAATSTAVPADTPLPAMPAPPTPTDTPTTIPTVELGTSNVFIEYILDASGSMTETLSDGLPKIEVAKRVLTDHMRSFRPETNIGLRAYGHRLPYQQTAESCQDIELIAPVEKGQMERIVSFLQGFEAQGMTPLAASLKQAQEDFVYEAPRVNSIVMLSDGIETCGGDPCKLVADLKAEGINFTIHVIGLEVDGPTRQQLSCIAQAGGGTYHDAKSQQELNEALGAVKADTTKDEVVVPAGVDTPTPVLLTETPLPSTNTPVPPTDTPVAALGIGSTVVSEKDGMELVYVPAGDFLMGSPEGREYGWERPQHTVYLNAFWIDQTEVTAAQFKRCVEAGACSAADTGVGCTYGDGAKSDHPVNCVDWSQAAAYCGWAGRRLPTEAEWEKAARGTDGRIYPWGDQEPDCERLNFSITGYGSCVGNTAPVGSYPTGASPYGALDMAGNVLEWAADWFDESYYASSPRENPSGPGTGSMRVLRGGSWDYVTDLVRAADRFRDSPDYRIDNYGFRCARSP